MHRRSPTWTRTFIRRGLVVAVAVATLAAYGLISGGQTAFRPTAAAPIGTESQLSVSEAISPTNHSVNVVAQGPNHSLLFYWEVGGNWYGPLGLAGSNTTYSAPAIVAEGGTGNFDIVVEGPSHTLWFYWDTAGTWYGPFGVGTANSTYSTPTIAVDANGHLTASAEGPSNTLYTYWNLSGTWYGPLGIGGPGTTFSAPNTTTETACGASCNAVYVFATGPHNDMREWVRPGNNPWSGPAEWSNDATAFSTGSDYYNNNCCGLYSMFEGPNHTLVQQYSDYQPTQISTAGTDYSTPSVVAGISEATRVSGQGPSHSLYFWFYGTNADSWAGPAQIAPAGSAYSAPSMAEETPDGTLDLAVQGPNNSLYFYWSFGGPRYGPIGVAGAGTTFGSSN